MRGLMATCMVIERLNSYKVEGLILMRYMFGVAILVRVYVIG